LLPAAAPRPPGADAALTEPPPGSPSVQVDTLLDGLDHPWDAAQAPDGTLLLDERGGGLTAVLPDGTPLWWTPLHLSTLPWRTTSPGRNVRP